MRRTLAFFVLLLVARHVRAQQVQHGFNWGFTDGSVSNTLIQCTKRSLHTIPLNTSITFTGTPPFYLTATEVGGVPTTDYVGSDPANLQWTVNHRAGTQLLLSLQDANGIGGGVGGNLYTVAPKSSECLPPPPPNPPNISSNMTQTVKTCEPWGLTITGGTPPYNVTLTAGGVGVTNVTMGPADAVVTYINRTPPNSYLTASVIDANGNFGTGTPLIHTIGSSDTVCGSLVTTSQTADAIEQEAASRAVAVAAAHAANQRTIVTGLAIGFPLFLLLVLAGGLYWWRRRRSGEPLVPDSEKQFGGNKEYAHRITPALLIPVTLPHGAGSAPSSRNQSPTSDISGPLDLYRPSTAYATVSASSSPTVSPPPPPPLPLPVRARPNSSSPLTAAHARKMAEASRHRPTRSWTANVVPARPEPSLTSSPPQGRAPTRSASTSALAVFQHRDGGHVPEEEELELPPPYLDRRDGVGTC